MARPTDWSPLDLHEDPTPGDPWEVADLARRFRETAKAVEDAVEGLGRLHAGDYKGKGGDAFRKRTKDLAGHLQKIHERYQEAHEALAAYHPEQNAAQADADAALSRATEAKADVRRWQDVVDDLEDERRRLVAAGTEVPADWGTRHSNAVHRRQWAHDQLTAAKTAAHKAHDRQDRAGTAAARKLKQAIDHDGLNDSWKDNLSGAVTGVLTVLADIASAISTIAGILALVFAWVPVLGEALAAIALVATLVATVCHLSLMLLGKGSWKDLMWDAISLASFGVGRAFAAGGKLAAVGARGRAWVAAKGMVTGNSAARYRAARALLGSKVGGAHRVPFSLGGYAKSYATGLAHGMREGLAPGNVMRDIRAIRNVHGLPTFSMGAFGRGAARALSGAGDDFTRLGKMSHDVAHAHGVTRLRFLSGATYTVGGASQLPSMVHDSIGLGQSAHDHYASIQDRLHGVSVGLADPGVPAGWTPSSSHMAPYPAGR